MKYIDFIIKAALIFVASATFTMMAPLVPSVQATASQQAACEGAGGTWNASEGRCGEGSDGIAELVRNINNVLLFVIGAVSILMLIIGGFRYVVSAGDSGAIESAKNTILYAVIGIIVAFLAYAAVNFIVDRLG